MNNYYDIIIVGAGIAGSAAATTFARQGHEVLLLERSLKEPDRIVGELLQPGGVIALEKLGLAAAVEGIDAIPVRGYHIYWKNEEVTFHYPPLDHESKKTENSYSAIAQGNGKPEGRSFHHGKFVSLLRTLAKNEERLTVVEATVRGLVTDKQTGRVIGVDCINNHKHKETYYSKLTIIADGASSNLRSQLRDQKPLAKSRFWGLELTDVELPYYGLAYGSIGNGPPIFIYQIGTRETRILIDIPNSVQENVLSTGDIRSYIADIVVPILPEVFRQKAMSALESDSGRLRSMLNEWLPATAIKIPGVLAIGDANNIRHPLTGGGMTVALKDVLLLRTLLDSASVVLDDFAAVNKRLQTFYWKRKAHCSSMNILAQALYTLFVAADPQLEVMQRGFVRYIRFGGKYSKEPSGLMGGIYHSPFLLFYHFFAIAIYSMWLLIRESPVWLLPVSLVRCVRVFVRAVSLILPFILSELWN